MHVNVFQTICFTDTCEWALLRMESGGGSLGLHTSDARMAHTMIMQDFGKAFSLLYFLIAK